MECSGEEVGRNIECWGGVGEIWRTGASLGVRMGVLGDFADPAAELLRLAAASSDVQREAASGGRGRQTHNTQHTHTHTQTDTHTQKKIHTQTERRTQHTQTDTDRHQDTRNTHQQTDTQTQHTQTGLKDRKIHTHTTNRQKDT